MSHYTSSIFEFNQAFGHTASPEKAELYQHLIDEEYEEWLEERYATAENIDPEAELKELCDLLYVIFGYCAQKAFDIDTAFQRVHQSNMSKLVDGIAQYNSQGKVIKGPNYKVPDLSDCVESD